ncbi:MAG: alpha-glucosidase/alpha-galactosidase, partial [Gemmatimonadetes bacterium]|nr:alpha-glucosidase/alpha-galactosidase [Gemmatimonadota bacterium]
MAIKVAVIGAGSIGFTRRLMKDILTVPELQDTEFAFHDINKHNLEMIAQLAQRDIEANGVPARLTTSVNRRRALDGAHYILNTTRIGGLEAFQSDIDIP